MKKIRFKATSLILVFLLVLPAATALADNEGVTWQTILDVFPDARRETYDKPIYATQHKTWLEFVSNMITDTDGKIFPMIYDEYGNPMQVEKLEYARISTGDHIANTSQYDSGELMMVSLQDVVIRGDVLGTGRLTISQLVCLAQVLNGEQQLSGLFLDAADVNGDGQCATLADVVTLGRWLIGLYS